MVSERSLESYESYTTLHEQGLFIHFLGQIISKTRRSFDLITTLLKSLAEVGLVRNRFYFCRCVVAIKLNAKEKYMYRFAVSVSDYILCIAWV